MPGKVKVKIISGRNLPVMDRSSDTTDAFVEVKLGNTTFKTDVYRKSLNPQWNSEWFIFEMADLDLQDEPLQIRIMDHDTYSANDAIGKVYIDLNPLLFSLPSIAHPDSGQSGVPIISGWLPVYDTMHGIRGEVNVMVKVDLFSDFNKFRQSSCGVRFFFNTGIPCGFRCLKVLGFVEELVTSDDPEYQWIDKIRTPRASNEARQALFLKLSGELQRKIGLKVLQIGANAVIAYRQCFDLEEDYGIVVRGLGTAVVLAPAQIIGPVEGCSEANLASSGLSQKDCSPTVPSSSPKRISRIRQSSGCASSKSPQITDSEGRSLGAGIHSPSHSFKVGSPSHSASVAINRRSSESDISITPKGGSFTGGGGSSGGKQSGYLSENLRPICLQTSFETMDFPFLSMKCFPPGYIVSIGSTVSAKAVKLLDRGHNAEELETRDSWWTSVRTEMKSHVRALHCNVILGYEEYTTVCEDVCVLTAMGTAALINMNFQEVDASSAAAAKTAKESDKREGQDGKGKENQPSTRIQQASTDSTESGKSSHRSTKPAAAAVGVLPGPPCGICHIPYSESSLPFPVEVSRCRVCKKGKVPDVLFTTLEPPSNFPVIGKGCLIQARFIRTCRDLKGELNAKEVSDALPFIEYEIYRQLHYSLKVKGMNMLFGLRIRITTGEKYIVAIATATGVMAAPLAPPGIPQTTVTGSSLDLLRHRNDIQKKLHYAVNVNKEMYGLQTSEDISEAEGGGYNPQSDAEDSEEDQLEVDLSSGNGGAFVLELDDQTDADFLNNLIEKSPSNVNAVTTQRVPGVPDESICKNIQMFSKIFRRKIPPNITHNNFSNMFDSLLQEINFKMRKFSPFVITGIKFTVELPEEDELQIVVQGGISLLRERSALQRKSLYNRRAASLDAKGAGKFDDPDLIFRMEEVNIVDEHSVRAEAGAKALARDKFQLSSPTQFPSASSTGSMSSTASSTRSAGNKIRDATRQRMMTLRPTNGIEVSPLDFIPGFRIEKYLGNLNFFFIRESTSIKENGGLSGFVASFVFEVLGLAKAHVAALGGNALTSFYISECILYQNQHKNQGQCLINICGDIVQSVPNIPYSLPRTEEIS